MVSTVFLADLPLTSCQAAAAFEAEAGQYEQEIAQALRYNEALQTEQANAELGSNGREIGSRRLAQFEAIPAA